MKGWLKTPADWARFDAWAKVRSLPKKIPVEEPIVTKRFPPLYLSKNILYFCCAVSFEFISHSVCSLGQQSH